MIRELQAFKTAINGPRSPISHTARIAADGSAEDVRLDDIARARRAIALHSGKAQQASELRRQAAALISKANSLTQRAGELSVEATTLEMYARDVVDAEHALQQRLLPPEAKRRLKEIDRENREIHPERQRVIARIEQLEKEAAPEKVQPERDPLNPPMTIGTKYRPESKAQRASRLAREATARDQAARQLPQWRERLAAIESRTAELQRESQKIRRCLIDSDEHHEEIERLRAIASAAEAEASAAA